MAGIRTAGGRSLHLDCRGGASRTWPTTGVGAGGSRVSRAPRVAPPYAAVEAAQVGPLLTDKRRIHLRSEAYGPTPFSSRDSLGSCQSAEQGDYKC
jgi:hypothetical protein